MIINFYDQCNNYNEAFTKINYTYHSTVQVSKFCKLKYFN